MPAFFGTPSARQRNFAGFCGHSLIVFPDLAHAKRFSLRRRQGPLVGATGPHRSMAENLKRPSTGASTPHRRARSKHTSRWPQFNVVLVEMDLRPHRRKQKEERVSVVTLGRRPGWSQGAGSW